MGTFPPARGHSGLEVNMGVPWNSRVTLALARRSGVPIDDAFARAELQRDLGLEPLDVVLFALSFEDNQGAAFHVEELEHTLTAGDLIATISQWLELRQNQHSHLQPAGAA
jgi:uncharacterized protein YciU (UPF0263 family)